MKIKEQPKECPTCKTTSPDGDYHTPDCHRWNLRTEHEKPQHTPTPWTLGNGTSREIWGYVDGYNEDRIATCASSNGLLNTDKQRANAAFIVRAVNCHEELVNALKEILNSTDCNLDDQSDETSKAMKKAYKILAKAEGNK